MDDLPVALAWQIETAREHVSWVLAAVVRITRMVGPAVIITVAWVDPTALVIPVTAVVVTVLDTLGARRASTDRQRGVIITVALVPVCVSRISSVRVVTRIEVHKRPPI
jgi:hypothetical protein